MPIPYHTELSLARRYGTIRESLALAKKDLNYTCNEEQASNVYSKLRRLKKIFLGELQESPQSHCAFEQPMFLGQVPVLGTPANLHEHLGSLKDKLLKKRIDLINKVCSRREEDLSLNQQQEITDFNMHKEKLELNLKKAHEKDLELINDLVMDSADKNDKIRLLKEEFMKKMTGLEKQMDCQYKKLKDMQLFARDKEQQIKNHWLEEAKAGKLTESFDSIPLSDSGFRLEELKLADQDEAHDGLRNRIYDSRESETLQNTQTGGLITVADVVTSGLNSKTSEAPTVFPPEGSGCLPNQINSLVSQSNVMYVTETESEPRETPLEVPSTLPPSKTVDLTIGTECLPSEAPVMKSVIIDSESLPSDFRESGPLQNNLTGELITVADLVTSGLNSKTSEGVTVFPPEGSGCLPNQVDSLVSQSNVMYVTETESEPRETPLEVPSTLPPSKAVDLTIGTESLPSEAPVMNSVINEADDIPINSITPATVETEKQRGAENSDILCSGFCPLGSIEEGRSMNDGEDASLNAALSQNQHCHTGFQNDVSPSQVRFWNYEHVQKGSFNYP
ncbi:hypothetical protein B296_00046212 [Ensete ventricosum]|uniref:MOM1 alpha-helical domain-containing protein n=1 Tax=Ensete ventricosum TaxID=4639 RepID=A0A426Z4L2_ENSVE|nr:hypothetical protein B296_00046212 [Ensete ventricosum]